VVVSELALSAVDGWFEPRSDHAKYDTTGIYCSLVSIHHLGIRAKTRLLGMRIMCPNGATCLSAECCFKID